MGTHTDPTTDEPEATEPWTADGSLLEEFVNAGNHAAFATLMQRHGPYVLRVCQQVTSHTEDAEDVFQACFLELVRNATTIREHASVVGWLQTVAVRLAKKARFRRGQIRHKEAASARPEAITSPDNLSWREACQLLQEELALLPSELRLPIILCHFEGKTQEEAAQEMAIPPRTVKDRLRRGREVLRSRLVQRGVSLAILGTLLAAGTVEAAVPAALHATTLKAAGLLATRVPLVGVVSPAVLALSAPPFTLAGLLTLTTLLGLCTSACYLAWEYCAPPPAALQELAPPAPARLVAMPPAPHKLHRSFRGKQFDQELFEWIGPNPEKWTRFDEEGLRITIPARDGPGDAVGIKLRYPVCGDFVLEGLLEFLAVEQPRDTWAAGANIYCYTNSPRRDGFWVAKMQDRTEGLIFSMGQRLTQGKKRITHFMQTTPTHAETGLARLRLVRENAQVSAFVAEGEAGAFQHLHTTEITSATLTIVRFGVDPAWSKDVAVDIRLHDFTIMAEDIVGYRPRAR